MCENFLRFLFIYFMLVLSFNLIYTFPATDTEDTVVVFDKENEPNLDETDYIKLGPYVDFIYGDPDENVGDIIKNWNTDVDGYHPEQMGNYWGGDIYIPTPLTRNGIIDMSKKWKNGIVPFQISGNFSKLLILP